MVEKQFGVHRSQKRGRGRVKEGSALRIFSFSLIV